MHYAAIPAVDVNSRQARLRSSDSITEAQVTPLHLCLLHFLLNSPKEISTIRCREITKRMPLKLM